VAHIIPRAVVPELDKVIANLELMPLRTNERKNAKVGSRQLDLGRKLQKAGLLSSEGLRALKKAEGELTAKYAKGDKWLPEGNEGKQEGIGGVGISDSGFEISEGGKLRGGYWRKGAKRVGCQPQHTPANEGKKRLPVRRRQMTWRGYCGGSFGGT
jgi:hypothetical protein